MSALSAVAPRSRPEPGRTLTLPRVIRSEWTKLWSLRSTRWTLLVAFVGMAGLGPLISAVSMARWSHLSPHERLAFDAIDRSLGGYHLAQLAIGVLGVLVLSGEYSTGQIRSSMMAVPRRLPVLWAKIIVFSVASFVLMLVAALIAFFASQSILTSHHVNVAISHPHALRALFGTVLYMTLTGVLCLGLAAILRSTAGGISAFVVLLFVLPGIVDILPSSIGHGVNPYLPSTAGSGVGLAVRDAHTLAAWPGFLLFCGYAIFLVLVGAYLMVRRDA